MRAAHALPLTVIGHATFLAAVDLHVGGVQVDGDRPFGQRCGPRRGRQVQHPRRDRRQPRSTAFHCPAVIRRATPAAVVELSPGTGASSCPAASARCRSRPARKSSPASCAAAIPSSSSPAPKPRSRCLTGPTAASRASITPSRSHNSLTAASPALGVSAASGAPTGASASCRVSWPPDRCLPR